MMRPDASTTTQDLFDDLNLRSPEQPQLAPGAMLLRGLALLQSSAILDAIQKVLAEAPLRHMTTPGGFRMSVAMSNCGEAGWVTDRRGYRYEPIDPLSGRPWPSMPAVFQSLAADAAVKAGFDHFVPDACLINRYETGARMSLHQDRNERDMAAPIVSVSLGAPAVFLFGGAKRNDKPQRIPLQHGDVLVWGGPSRLFFHGVMPLKPHDGSVLGAQRINLTFRKAL